MYDVSCDNKLSFIRLVGGAVAEGAGLEKLFFLDWIPFATQPYRVTLGKYREVSRGDFPAFFERKDSPSFIFHEYVASLEMQIKEFGFQARGDGILIFWFEPSSESIDESQANNAARLLSYGLKEVLDHRHVFHGFSYDLGDFDFTPVRLSPLDRIRDAGDFLTDDSVEFESWDASSPLNEKIERILNESVVLMNLSCFGRRRKPAVLALRRKYSEYLGGFYIQKDKIRMRLLHRNLTSIGVLFFLWGLFGPLWKAVAVENGYGFEYVIASMGQVILFMFGFVALFVRVSSWHEGFKRSRRSGVRLYSRIFDPVFSELSWVRKKIAIPSLLSLSFFLTLSRGNVFEYFNSTSRVDDRLRNIWEWLDGGSVYFTYANSFQVVSIWMVGISLIAYLEIFKKRHQISKLARSYIAFSYHGEVISNIYRRYIDVDGLEVSFASYRQILKVFLSHEAVKLRNAWLIVLVASIVAMGLLAVSLFKGMPNVFIIQ